MPPSAGVASSARPLSRRIAADSSGRRRPRSRMRSRTGDRHADEHGAVEVRPQGEQGDDEPDQVASELVASDRRSRSRRQREESRSERELGTDDGERDRDAAATSRGDNAAAGVTDPGLRIPATRSPQARMTATSPGEEEPVITERGVEPVEGQLGEHRHVVPVRGACSCIGDFIGNDPRSITIRPIATSQRASAPMLPITETSAATSAIASVEGDGLRSMPARPARWLADEVGVAALSGRKGTRIFVRVRVMAKRAPVACEPNQPSDRGEPAIGQPPVGKGAFSRRSLVAALVLGLPASAILLLLAARGVDADVVFENVRRARLPRIASAWPRSAVLPAAGDPVALDRPPRGGAFDRPVPSVRHQRGCVQQRRAWAPRGFPPSTLARTSRRQPSYAALGTVVVDRASDVLVLVAALGSSFLFVGHEVSWLMRIDLAAAVTGAILLLGLFGARFYVRRRPEGVAGSRVGRLVGGVLAGAARGGKPARRPVVAALSAAAWGAWAAGAWSIAAAVGIPLSPLEVIFVMAVVNLGVAIPSSPGFVGTYQWLCVASLALLGVDGERAFAFSVILHAAWFVPTTIAGAALLAHNGVRRASRREAPIASAAHDLARASNLALTSNPQGGRAVVR